MEPPSPYRISISNDSGRRPRLAPLLATVRLALAQCGLPAGELSIRLSDEESVRQANLAFRGLDETTDVLTFPAAEIPCPESRLRPLGDLMISVPQAQRQATARGYRLEHELAYLALHGVLHLAGYDDETEADRTAMLTAMAELGRSAGLPDLGEWHTLAAGALA